MGWLLDFWCALSMRIFRKPHDLQSSGHDLPLIKGFWNGKSWNLFKTSNQPTSIWHTVHGRNPAPLGTYKTWINYLSTSWPDFWTINSIGTISTVCVETPGSFHVDAPSAVMWIFICILVASSHGSAAKQCLDHAVPTEQRLNITLDGLLVNIKTWEFEAKMGEWSLTVFDGKW